MSKNCSPKFEFCFCFILLLIAKKISLPKKKHTESSNQFWNCKSWIYITKLAVLPYQNKQQTSFISRFIKILNWLLDSVKSFETKQGMGQICMFRSRCEILAENLCLDFYWHVTCFEIYLPLKRCWHQWKCHCSLFSPRWC